MSNKIPFTADDAITLEMLNSFVRDSQIEHLNEGEIWLMSKSAIQNALATKADKSNFTKFIFNESVTSLINGYTYYGCTINHTVSSGTYYFCNCTVDLTVGGDDTTWGTCYFYNCTGTLTVSGKTPTIYATNCPQLTINGKTDENWQNIWIDGVACYDNIVPGASGARILRFIDGTQIISGMGLCYAEDVPTSVPVYFPVSFANTGYTLTGNMLMYAPDYDATIGFANSNKGNFTVSFKSASNSKYRNTIFYTAIGRWK